MLTWRHGSDQGDHARVNSSIRMEPPCQFDSTSRSTSRSDRRPSIPATCSATGDCSSNRVSSQREPASVAISNQAVTTATIASPSRVSPVYCHKRFTSRTPR